MLCKNGENGENLGICFPSGFSLVSALSTRFFAEKIVYKHMCYTRYGEENFSDEKIFIFVEKSGNFY